MKFDVFVSFAGTDTRRTFVSHLLLSLSKKRITVYPEYMYFRVIEESKIAIVVISKNYVASFYYLDELADIIEHKKRASMEVVPVFYEVDPWDVLRQIDDLGDNGDVDDNLVKRWRDALETLIEIYHQKYSYWENEDSYSYIVDQVLIHVSHSLSKSEIAIDVESDWIVSSNNWSIFNVQEMAHTSSRRYMATTSSSPNIEPISYGLLGTKSFPKGQSEKEDYAIPRTSLLSLLSPIVSKGIRLVAAALRTIAGKLIYGEGSNIGVKIRPPRSLLDMHNDNYVTGDNLSRLIQSNDCNSFIGMDRLTKAIHTLLDLELRDSILEIGIFGEKGVGKTTLARCVYEQISPQFQDHHYINDITNCSLGVCLLDDIARSSLTEDYESLHEVVKAKLGHRKVLLIVDNISESRQLSNIRNISRWFGPGSRLIFITNVKYLLLSERLYVVEPLRYDEALQLFSQFAFKQEQVPREHYQLSVRAVIITGRIPLALKVFGTFLCGKHISEWENELCRLETPESTWDCVAKVSSYIRRTLS